MVSWMRLKTEEQKKKNFFVHLKMVDKTENPNRFASISRCFQCSREKIIWKNVRYFCCQSRKDVRIFWFCYFSLLITLFIILMIAFLHKPSITINYSRWYNDSCSIDFVTSSPVIECDRSLSLYCHPTIERCVCLHNMFWNNSFCDCSRGMFFNKNYCQERLSFGKSCDSQIDSCMEYLTCSTNTNTCDCPSSSYYNQTTCNLKLSFNATKPCTLASQCMTGLVCSSNVCTCPASQSWNGNGGCSNSSTHGQYCLTTAQCDYSALLICNSAYFRCTCGSSAYWDGQICRSRRNNGSLCKNTQQCSSNLICLNNYCQCPLPNTQYWSGQISTCQLDYLFTQHARVFNWTPIYLATNNPIPNYFQWSIDQTLIKPSYLCNETIVSNYTGYALAFKLETYTPCLRAWSSTINGQLVNQLNNYVYHTR